MRISRGKSDSLVKFNYKIDGMRGLSLAVTPRIIDDNNNENDDNIVGKMSMHKSWNLKEPALVLNPNITGRL